MKPLNEYMSRSVNENANSIITRIADYCKAHNHEERYKDEDNLIYYLPINNEYSIGENGAVIYAVSFDGQYVYIRVMDSTDAVPSTVFSDAVLMDIYEQIQSEYK